MGSPRDSTGMPSLTQSWLVSPDVENTSRLSPIPTSPSSKMFQMFQGFGGGGGGPAALGSISAPATPTGSRRQFPQGLHPLSRVDSGHEGHAPEDGTQSPAYKAKNVLVVLTSLLVIVAGVFALTDGFAPAPEKHAQANGERVQLTAASLSQFAKGLQSSGCQHGAAILTVDGDAIASESFPLQHTPEEMHSLQVIDSEIAQDFCHVHDVAYLDGQTFVCDEVEGRIYAGSSQEAGTWMVVGKAKGFLVACHMSHWEYQSAGTALVQDGLEYVNAVA
eukprot:GFYU01003824.1.p1 GENE.GFYU01003824.1~~GFYU01003824.1.p1  ORF type:complete len:277 (-),score=45.02 GFYU01003824.1:223-1053(-)